MLRFLTFIKQRSSAQKFELIFILLSFIVFAVHLCLIMLSKGGYIDNREFRDSSYISAIASPFTVIIIYEILQLAFSFKNPILHFLIVQFQVISLIYIRNVFKVFADLEVQALINGDVPGLIREVALMIGASVFLFGAARTMNEFMKKHKCLSEEDVDVIKMVKKWVSWAVVVGAIFMIGSFFLGAESPYFFFSADLKISDLFSSIFTLMILADVIIFFLTLIANDTYTATFRHAAYIAAAVLIRLSISVAQPYDVFLVIISSFLAIGISLFQVVFPHDC